MQSTTRPFGRPSYGSIGHLPGSKFTSKDKGMNEGHTRIATLKTRDKHDNVYVQEKLDGTCVAVGKLDGNLLALSRSGYLAHTSKYEFIRLFESYMHDNYERFDALLDEGERVVGEWLAMAHGTKYDLSGRDPFVMFDIMVETTRMPFMDLTIRNRERLGNDCFFTPMLIAQGPTSVEDAMKLLQTKGENVQGEFPIYGFYGATEPVEGAVWRVERRGEVDFLCKFVRPDYEPGKYLPEVSGEDPIWNWP